MKMKNVNQREIAMELSRLLREVVERYDDLNAHSNAANSLETADEYRRLDEATDSLLGKWYTQVVKLLELLGQSNLIIRFTRPQGAPYSADTWIEEADELRVRRYFPQYLHALESVVTTLNSNLTPPKYDHDAGIISFRGTPIPILMNGPGKKAARQHDLCRMVFADHKSMVEGVELGDITDHWIVGERTDDEIYNMVYQVVNAVNQKVEILAEVKALLKLSNNRVRVNSLYL